MKKSTIYLMYVLRRCLHPECNANAENSNTSPFAARTADPFPFPLSHSLFHWTRFNFKRRTLRANDATASNRSSGRTKDSILLFRFSLLIARAYATHAFCHNHGQMHHTMLPTTCMLMAFWFLDRQQL